MCQMLISNERYVRGEHIMVRDRNTKKTHVLDLEVVVIEAIICEEVRINTNFQIQQLISKLTPLIC